MKLRKFTAVSLTVAMTAATLFGCGAKEDDAKGSSNEKKIESSADSFADAVGKISEFENCDYEVNLSASVDVDGLLDSVGEEAEILDKIGISSDKINVKIGLDGSMKGSDAQTMNISYEIGDLSGDLMDYVYVDGDLYLNVAKAVDAVETIADKIGMGSEIKTYTALVPEGDYIEIESDVITSIYDTYMDAVVTESGIDMEDIDEEAIAEAGKYLLGEVEKVAKGASNAYSDKNGYKISINNGNIVSFMLSFIDVFREDGDEIIKNIEKVVGDTGISAEDLLEEINAMEDEDLDEAKEAMESSIDDMGGDISLDVAANATDKEWTFGYTIGFEADGAKADIAFDTKITKNDDVSIKAPSSVMEEEDVNAILSLMGFDSMDDIVEQITSSASMLDTSYDDYDFDSSYGLNTVSSENYDELEDAYYDADSEHELKISANDGYTSLELVVGTTEALNITLPTGYTASDLVYASYDENVAKVDTKGVVTPVSEGTIWIYFATSDLKYAGEVYVNVTE